MIIHVRNFGKIESADIDLSNLIIFVGENNSGKTYLMQLIYGLFSFMRSREFNAFMEEFDDLYIGDKITEVKSDNADFYKSFQDEINYFIDINKDEIIKKTFHTRNLTIDSLSVEFKSIDVNWSIIYQDEIEVNERIKKRYFILRNDERIRGLGFGEKIPTSFIEKIIKAELLSTILFELTGLKKYSEEEPMIYLPASRSGIMLLYANYLANDKKNNYSEENEFVIEPDNNDDLENEYGLTEPVYNFLMFLLKHKNSEIPSDFNKELISFIDQNIINGSIEKVGNTVRYKPSASDQSMPIYLSSSLVSELAPIYQILSGVQRFSYIMYDEMETCQHPTKQLQLARLLVRMVNAGYKMIVSTHSDTMVAAINNLVTLSFKKERDKLIDKLGYQQDDILESKSIKAYQFIVESQKTKVVEVPNHFSVGIGFDFSLFNKSNDKIYQDAIAITEVD